MMLQTIDRKYFKYSQILCDELFKLLTSKLEGFSAFENIHLLINSKLLEKGTDQATNVHRIIYSDFDKGLQSPSVLAYRQLCREWVNDLRLIFAFEDWAVQRYPSIRVHLPRNKSVFEFHRDSDYSHPLGEINHFLAITKCQKTASLHVEQSLGWEDFKPLELAPLQSAILNTSIFKHGDFINVEEYTRLSLDFRAIPLHCIVNQEATRASLTKGKTMDLTDYYLHSSNLLDED